MYLEPCKQYFFKFNLTLHCKRAKGLVVGPNLTLPYLVVQ